MLAPPQALKSGIHLEGSFVHYVLTRMPGTAVAGLLWLFDRLAKIKPERYGGICLAVATPIFSLMNNGLFTGILTHWVLLSFFLAWLMLRPPAGQGPRPKTEGAQPAPSIAEGSGL